MHELPDENLRDILVIAKRIDIAQGVPHYNNLQKKITDGFKLHTRYLHQLEFTVVNPVPNSIYG